MLGGIVGLCLGVLLPGLVTSSGAPSGPSVMSRLLHVLADGVDDVGVPACHPTGQRLLLRWIDEALHDHAILLEVGDRVGCLILGPTLPSDYARLLWE